MRKHIIGAASAVALLCTGAAYAQTATTTTTPNATSTEATRPATTMRDDANGVVGSRASAESLMGRTVIGADGKDLGEIKDVILDANSGEARQVVIASGGFLGIGEKNIAVDFSDAQLLAGKDQVQVNSLTQAQVEKLDGYEYDQDTVSLSRGGATAPATPGASGQ